MGEVLRVVDFGSCSPLRSQTSWHAIAHGVSNGQPATLSFARPSDPYVCLGYHRSLDELDGAYCRAHALPVLRRMVGGGPVYLDSHQLFFQICVPSDSVSAVRAQALRSLLEPAVAAFRAVGIEATLDGDLEITLDDRKICGHGAGQLEGAVVVCGNLIERFDHSRATRVLAFRDGAQREQTLALMQRFVAATPVDPDSFKEAMVSSYALALRQTGVKGALSELEIAAVAEFDDRFTSAEWLVGPGRTPSGAGTAPRARQVKVRAGVWTLGARYEGARVAASIVRGTVDVVRLFDAQLRGAAREAEAALTGTPLASVASVLERFGAGGRRLAGAFATAQPGRL